MSTDRHPLQRPFSDYLERLAAQREAVGQALPDIFADDYWEARRKIQKQAPLPWWPNNRRPERPPDNNKPNPKAKKHD